MPRKKPKAKKRVQFSDQHSENDHKSRTYCVCQKAASGFMLQCDRCKEWYHGACVKIPSAESLGEHTEFVCVVCSESKCSELITYPRKFVITRRSIGPSVDRRDVPAYLHQLSFCTCNSRDDGRMMVRCSICKEWYHTDCVELPWPAILASRGDDTNQVAFACLRCTDDRSHQLVDEDVYYELCDKRRRHGAVCERLNTTHSSARGSSFLRSLCGNELGHRSSLSLSNLQWNNFKTLELYDIHSWSEIAPWVLKRVPTSPSLISIGTNRGSVEIFDLAPDQSLEPLQEKEKNWIATRVKSLHRGALVTTLDDISAMEWGHDGSIAVVGTWADGRIEVIDAHENTTVRAYEDHAGLVRSLHIPKAFPHMLVSASHDKRVILWDFRSAAKKVLEGHSGKVVGARTLPSYSEHCIISAGDSTIRVWDIRREDSCLHTISVPEDKPISSLDISETNLAVNTSPGNMFMFSNLDLFSPSTLPHCAPLKGYTNKYWSMGKVYFSPDGKYLATGSEDGYLLAWDVKTGDLVYRSRTHSHWVWDLAWLPDSSAFPAPSIATCSEDFTMAVSGVGPGVVHNRMHEWGPAGYKNVRVPYASKVFARWPNGRYYHGTVDHEVTGVGGGGMCSVKFRGWHGPDSRAIYEPIALFPDSSNCTCKKGHAARDIPFVNSSMDIPLSPPPSPSVTPSPTISPLSSPRHSPEPVVITPAPERRKRNKPTPVTTTATPPSDSSTTPSPPRVSKFGRTIKKSRFLDSPPPSPKHTKNKNKTDLKHSPSVEISPTPTAKRTRKSLLFSHSEIIPLPSETELASSQESLEPNQTPQQQTLLSNQTRQQHTLPLDRLPEFSPFIIPWSTPPTVSPNLTARHLTFSPPYPLSPHSPTQPQSQQTLPSISSLLNFSPRDDANVNTSNSTTRADYQDKFSPVQLSPPKS